MLTDWYFCCCIGAPISNAAVYLSILDTLKDRASRPELLVASVNELRKTDLWMRAYALPTVLPMLSRADLRDARSLWLYPYFVELLEALPEDLQAPFGTLQSALLSDQPVKMEVVEDCIASVRHLPERASSKPYLDLRELLPETYILAILAELLASGRIPASVLELSEATTSGLPLFLRAASNGEYGRMAFVMAIDLISRFRSERERSDAADRIWRQPRRTALEPDLLRAFARLMLLSNPSGMDASAATNRVIDESISFSALRGRYDGNETPFNPTVTDASQDVRRALSLVLWQITLWELAADLHPRTAAERLAAMWAPRWHPAKPPQAIGGPLKEKDAQFKWKRQLELLLAINQLLPGAQKAQPVPKTSIVRTRFSEEFDDCEAAVFCSPWLMHWIRRGKGNMPDLRYPAAANHAALARVLGSMCVAAHLLRSGQLTPNSARHLARLLVHGSDVLSQYRYWLNKYESPTADEKKASLPGSWTLLALQARRLSSSIARCSLSHVDPSLFTALLSVESAEAQLPSEQRDIFYQNVVPGTLVSWVQDAYLAVTDDTGPARWISHVPELYESVQGTTNFLHRIEAAVLMRFLVDPGFHDPDLEWWRATSRGKPLHWAVAHRQLLLVRGLKAVDWKRDWDDPARDKYPAQHQVRAVERRASLGRIEGLDSVTAELWRREWLNELGDVAELMELDRFLRVRLLELLDDPVLEDSVDEQSVVAMLLLDYGSHFDLHRLLEQLFPFDDHGRLIPPRTEQRQLVRKQMLEAMLKYVASSEATESDKTEARDPNEVVRYQRRVSMVEECLWRIAFAAVTFPDRGGDAHLAESLANLCQRRRVALPRTRRTAVGHIELEDRSRRLMWEPSQCAPDWAVHSYSCDWTGYEISAAIEDRDIDGCTNLFEWNSDAISKFETQPSSRDQQLVLALVIDVIEDRSGFTYVLNCGFRKRLISSLPQQYRPNGQPIHAGDVISLRLRWVGEAKKPGWRAQEPFRLLPPSSMPGAFEFLSVEEDLVNYRTDLRRPFLPEIVTFNADEWDVDLSRSYARSPATDRVLATMRDARWMPVDHSFTEFLIDAFGGQNTFVVASLVEREIRPATMPLYRFSLGFGAHYVVPSERFAEEDRVVVEEKLKSLSQPVGLLISLSLAYRGDQVQLCLWKHGISGDAHRLRFPELTTPFDDRNLRWRSLDDHLSGAAAQKVGNNWYVNTRDCVPQPFPERVKVTPLKGYFPPRGGSVELIPVSWNPRTCVLVADAVSYHELDITPTDRGAFVRRWLELQRGEPVLLTRAYPKPGVDLVTCLTVEKVGIYVEAESLSMQPFPQGVPRQGFSRWARVVSTSGWYMHCDKLPVDELDVPEQLRDADRSEGVLSSVPKVDDEDGTLCKVWWRFGETTLESTIVIQNLGTRARLHPGMKVVVSRSDDGWHLWFENRRLIAKALWVRIDGEDYDDYGSLFYLGPVTEGGVGYHIAEQRPGELVFLRGRIIANHLAEGRGRAFRDGIAPNERITCDLGDEGKHRTWVERSVRVQRAFLNIKGKALPGIVPSHSPEQGAVAGVQIAIQDAGEDETGIRYYSLRRFFRVAPVLTVFSSEMEEARRLRQLKEYLDSPDDLEGAWERGRNVDSVRLGLWVPDVDKTGSWTNVVKIGAGEGPFIKNASYPLDAKVRLFGDVQGPVFASCRLVPPISIQEYQEDVLDVPTLQKISLADWLYYVGEEPGQPGYHRFEWRAGCTVLAHETQLRFDCGPFTTARGILFPSDAITSVRFVEDEAVEGMRVMEIDQVNLDFAEASRLYRQRTRYHVVHILEVEQENDDVRIAAVIGLSERLDPFYKFERIEHARIEGLNVDWNRASESTSHSSGPVRTKVLGRLDSQRFLDSLGKDLVFEHVRMSFQPSPSGGCLRDGELIFMRASRISAVRNDVVLSLREYGGLYEGDIDPNWNRCGVLRREFSVRDDLLLRLFRREGSAACHDTVYLVRVSEGEAAIHCSLVKGGPARNLNALSSIINNSRGPVLAAVAGRESSSLRVEFQPGVFFELPPDRLDYDSSNTEGGACVRIEHISSMNEGSARFRLTTATFSHARYVPTTGRPAVALPKNRLLRELPSLKQAMSPWFWVGSAEFKNKPFTISGLPGIEATPAAFQESPPQWLLPDPGEFVDLMRSRHPDRCVVVGRDEHGDFRIVPLRQDTWKAGRLSLELEPAVVPFSGRLATNIPLSWSRLSFADESIREIEARCRELSWRCHDERSGSWSDAGVDWYELPRETAEQGPVFFEHQGRNITLRYRRDNLKTFGFPVQELFDALSEANRHQDSYVVVGRSDEGGLWIELAPGHIAEVPGQLMVCPMRVGEFSLANLNWHVFSSGDRVVLRLMSDRAFRVDRVALVGWYPGPRGAFAQARCILPVVEQNAEEGSTVLGAGQFCFRLPTRDAFPRGLVILSRDNSSRDADSVLPMSGDVILLELRDGVPVALAAPGLRPLADRQRVGIWQKDPLASEVKGERLARLIEAMGGALPVTVEAVVPSSGVLYFSRRLQTRDLTIPPGAVAQTRPLGFLTDTNTLLLRCGSGILKAQASDLIQGLPTQLGPNAFEALKNLAEPIWMRGSSEGGRLKFGVADEANREFLVEALEAVSLEGGGHLHSGFICRSADSLALYWLPSDRFAWARLTAEELRIVLARIRHTMFPVCLVSPSSSSPVTLIDVPAVRKEFIRLEVGRTLDVTLVSERTKGGDEDGGVVWLAESVATRIVLECCAESGPEHKPGDHLRVEVVRRTVGTFSSLVVVPLGAKKYHLDLPRWVLSDAGRAGSPIGEQQSYYLSIDQESRLPDSVQSTRSLTAEELDQALVSVWRTVRDPYRNSAERALIGAAVARTWIDRHLAERDVSAALAIMAALVLHYTAHKDTTDLEGPMTGLEPQDIQRALIGNRRRTVAFACST